MPPTAGGAVTATRVFIPFNNGKLYALDLATGDGVLVLDLPTRFAPVIDGPRVLVTGDRVVDAVLAADGTRQWTAPLADAAVAAPVVRGGWAFVSLANGSVAGLSSDTGRTVWTTPLGPPVASIVVEGDRLYSATTGGAVHAVAVADGTPMWRATLDSDVTALAAVEGHVFAATTGRWLYSLDARRGEVRWRFRIQGAAIGLTVDEDRVVAVMLDQSARAFKIRSGAQAWRQELAFRPAGGPVLSGSSVLVTGFAPTLRTLDRRTGADHGHYAIPLADLGGSSLETLVSGPIVRVGDTVFQDLVVLVTQQGLVHAARRLFDPPPTPVTAMPGTIVPAPLPPPGWVAPPAPSAPSDPAAPAATPGPATPPTSPAAPAAPPAGDTPPRRPPAPPVR
jgi:outer membrane protein assembly factor BamB